MINAAVFRRIKTICQPDTQVLGIRTLTTLESVEDSNNLPNNPLYNSTVCPILSKKVLLRWI